MGAFVIFLAYRTAGLRNIPPVKDILLRSRGRTHREQRYFDDVGRTGFLVSVAGRLRLFIRGCGFF